MGESLTERQGARPLVGARVRRCASEHPLRKAIRMHPPRYLTRKLQHRVERERTKTSPVTHKKIAAPKCVLASRLHLLIDCDAA